MVTLTEEYISKCLAESHNSPTDAAEYNSFMTDSPRPAAVLIPLFHAIPEDAQNHTWHLLLTRRTHSVAEHQDQVAFPGGRADPTDLTPEATALREAHEEIGLDPVRVKVLGRMKRLPTISNYCVTPVVGVIPWPFEIQIEETEVSRVFSIPLDWLADPANHEIHYRTIPAPDNLGDTEEKHPVIFYNRYQDELLWGVSAQITLAFVNLLYQHDNSELSNRSMA